MSISNVSPSTGLKGFQVRSAAPKGETRKAATSANLCEGMNQAVDTVSCDNKMLVVAMRLGMGVVHA